jgi:hypothetical protein
MTTAIAPERCQQGSQSIQSDVVVGVEPCRDGCDEDGRVGELALSAA